MWECRVSRWRRLRWLRSQPMNAMRASVANPSPNLEVARAIPPFRGGLLPAGSCCRVVASKHMNYKLLLQYDGTDFHGWQIQTNLRTVQGELTRVLSLLDNRAVTVSGSGRTDAGVHAEGQVANVHLQREITPDKLRNAINGNLEGD